MIKQLPLDSTKFIPVDQLSSENVLYWRCLIGFSNNKDYSDELEQIMPELTRFCEYIKNFITVTENKSNKPYEQITEQFILQQLFDIVKLHDLADERGRRALKELSLETLKTYDCSEKISQSIIQYLEIVEPDVTDRIASLVEVINEIRMPTNINADVQTTEAKLLERQIKVIQKFF